MYTLIIEDRNGDIADEYSFEEGAFVIGRSLQSDIILPSENVSRSHARLFTRGGRCFIEDAGSSNGVFLNGRRVRQAQEIVRSGQIKVGDFYLHIDTTADGAMDGAATYCVLEAASPGLAGRTYSIGRPVSILGRGRDCTTTIIDPSVSRVHATLWADADGILRIEDLRSANGTFVNGERTTTAVLNAGDRLRLGNVEFVVQQPAGAVRAPAQAPPGAPGQARPLPVPHKDDEATRLRDVTPPDGVAPSFDEAIALDEVELVDEPPAPRVGRPLAIPDAPRARPAMPSAMAAGEAYDSEAMPSVGFAVHDDFMVYRHRRRLFVGIGAVVLAGAVAAAFVWWPSDGTPGTATEGTTLAEADPTEADPTEGAPEAAAPSEPAEAAAPKPAEEPEAAKDRGPDEAGAPATVAAKTPPPAAEAPAQVVAAASPPPATKAPATPSPAAAQPSEIDLLKQGEAAMRDHKWDDARKVFETLRDRDPLSPTWQSMLNRAALEAHAEQRWLEGSKQLAERQLGEALKSLRGVTPQSAWYEQARTKVNELLDGRDALVSKGDALCKQKQWAGCHDLYVDAFAITPDDSDLGAKIKTVRKKLGK